MKRSKILGLVLSGIFAFNLAAISSVNAATTDNSVKEETTTKIQAISDSDKYNGECVLFATGAGNLPQYADFGFKGTKKLYKVVYIGNATYMGYYR